MVNYFISYFIFYGYSLQNFTKKIEADFWKKKQVGGPDEKESDSEINESIISNKEILDDDEDYVETQIESTNYKETKEKEDEV